MRPSMRALLVGACVCTSIGCAAVDRATVDQQDTTTNESLRRFETDGAAPRPARISHVVLVTLTPEHRSHTSVAQMRADAFVDLATIPGVVSFAAGPHLETGRATVTDGYDLGLYIGFDTERAYEQYVVHPRHTAFVERWRPKLASLVVYDFVDR